MAQDIHNSEVLNPNDERAQIDLDQPVEFSVVTSRGHEQWLDTAAEQELHI